jgi:predicted nucleic acid-binding Zn ribbon protein
LETLDKQHKLCKRCGKIIQGRTGPNTKYCDECKEIVRKQRERERLRKLREKGNKEDNEQVRARMEKYRGRWNTILKQYRYDAIGNAYNEHGKLMNQYHTGKGTNNFGPHANPDFDKEMELVWKEKKRRGLV